MKHLESDGFYVGQRTFPDTTASLAVNNVLSQHRSEVGRDKAEEREIKKAARKAVRERYIEDLNPSQQRVVELSRTIQGFTDQVRSGELGRERFKVVTKPLRLELSQLTRI